MPRPKKIQTQNPILPTSDGFVVPNYSGVDNYIRDVAGDIWVRTAGDTMSGNLTFSAGDIIHGGVTDPWVEKAGDTMTGKLTISAAVANPLEVNSGTINAVAAFKSTDALAELSLSDGDTTTDKERFTTRTGNALSFWTNNLEFFQADSSGNIDLTGNLEIATSFDPAVSTAETYLFDTTYSHGSNIINCHKISPTVTMNGATALHTIYAVTGVYTSTVTHNIFKGVTAFNDSSKTQTNDTNVPPMGGTSMVMQNRVKVNAGVNAGTLTVSRGVFYGPTFEVVTNGTLVTTDVQCINAGVTLVNPGGLGTNTITNYSGLIMRNPAVPDGCVITNWHGTNIPDITGTRITNGPYGHKSEMTNGFFLYHTGTAPSQLGGDLDTRAGRTTLLQTITGTDTLVSSDHVTLCNSASAFTLTLPAAASNSGRVYRIKNINTGAVTIDANGAELIDGATTAVLTAQYDSIDIISNGTSWFIL